MESIERTRSNKPSERDFRKRGFIGKRIAKLRGEDMSPKQATLDVTKNAINTGLDAINNPDPERPVSNRDLKDKANAVIRYVRTHNMGKQEETLQFEAEFQQVQNTYRNDKYASFIIQETSAEFRTASRILFRHAQDRLDQQQQKQVVVSDARAKQFRSSSIEKNGSPALATRDEYKAVIEQVLLQEGNIDTLSVRKLKDRVDLVMNYIRVSSGLMDDAVNQLNEHYQAVSRQFEPAQAEIYVSMGKSNAFRNTVRELFTSVGEQLRQQKEPTGSTETAALLKSWGVGDYNTMVRQLRMHKTIAKAVRMYNLKKSSTDQKIQLEHEGILREIIQAWESSTDAAKVQFSATVEISTDELNAHVNELKTAFSRGDNASVLLNKWDVHNNESMSTRIRTDLDTARRITDFKLNSENSIYSDSEMQSNKDNKEMLRRRIEEWDQLTDAERKQVSTDSRFSSDILNKYISYLRIAISDDVEGISLLGISFPEMS